MPDLSGQSLGPYQSLERIGQGGMATVYRAYHPPTDRYVAIKVLPDDLAEDPSFHARFEREARVVAGLQHVHILPLFDYGQEGDVTYLVMPYAAAGTLKDYLTGRPPLPDAVRLFCQLAEAVDYAHRRGVIHRDLKPSNVLLDESGNVLLSDFGLTRMIESTSDLTRSGALGTPAYMSPEQGQGQPVDARADIYSLGVLLYEMLVGEVPFTADTPIAVIYKHVHEPLPMPRTRRPDLPGAVEKVITKALAKAPEDRFKTAGQMADALRRAVLVAPQETSSDEQDTLPDGPPLRTGSTEAVTLPAAKKRRLPLWGLLLGLALIVALVVGADLVMLYVGKAERTATQAAMLSLVRPTGTVTPLPTVAPTRVAVRGAASATPTGTATATVTASPSPPPTDAPTLTVTRTATTTPRPTVTTIPTLTTAPVACADSPTPRLVVGYQGQTLPGEEPLSNIRYTPAGARIGHLYPEETFDVVGGPQCATLSGYDLAWWQVVAHGSGLAGWVAEGFEGIYWLHPLDAANAGLAVATPAPVCAGAPPARMRLGYQGQTNPKDTTPTYLREQPGAGEDVASIGPGVSFDVIDGPACAAVHGVEYVWWRVRLHSSGVEGWVAEGDAQLYWIEPINRAAHP